ncbi:MAG: hypothetical protein M3Y56_08780 [Armatimonadota bacterium]|nr:hypothetical protein [Armatimonadota bacterium]
MIKINKPKQPPAILLSKGKAKRQYLCASYTRYSAEYISGKRAFIFDSGVYGHATVRQSLAEAQYNKCCFCEVKLRPGNDIEHFRPKGAYRQGAKVPLNKFGYYWLAYDWNNLLLACKTCNQQYKRSFFPLANPARRAKSHHDDIAEEEPLLIHPAEQDPELFIGFRDYVAYAIAGNLPGKTTIDVLGLNEESLNEARRVYLRHLQAVRDLVGSQEGITNDPQMLKIIANAKALLLHAVDPSAPYAAMARANHLNVF